MTTLTTQFDRTTLKPWENVVYNTGNLDPITGEHLGTVQPDWLLILIVGFGLYLILVK